TRERGHRCPRAPWRPGTEEGRGGRGGQPPAASLNLADQHGACPLVVPGPIAVPDPTVPLLVPVPVWPEPLPRLEPVPEDAPGPVLGEVAEPMVVVPEPVLGAVALAPGAVDELVPGDVAEPVPDPLIVPELPVPLPSVEPVPAVWFPVVEPVPAAEPGGQFPLDASAPVDDDAPDVPVPELP